MWPIQLCLREVRKQAVVAAVAVDDNDLLAAVAGHFISGLLQQVKLKPRAVGYRAGLVLCLEDLSKIILGKDDCVLLLRRIQSGVADVEQIIAQRQVEPVLLQDAERQQAYALSARNAIAELRRAELLPMD